MLRNMLAFINCEREGVDWRRGRKRRKIEARRKETRARKRLICGQTYI